VPQAKDSFELFCAVTAITLAAADTTRARRQLNPPRWQPRPQPTHTTRAAADDICLHLKDASTPGFRVPLNTIDVIGYARLLARLSRRSVTLQEVFAQ
jgi:hypothetical protein